jgi:hypothetical protein
MNRISYRIGGWKRNNRANNRQFGRQSQTEGGSSSAICSLSHRREKSYELYSSLQRSKKEKDDVAGTSF